MRGEPVCIPVSSCAITSQKSPKPLQHPRKHLILYTSSGIHKYTADSRCRQLPPITILSNTTTHLLPDNCLFLLPVAALPTFTTLASRRRRRSTGFGRREDTTALLPSKHQLLDAAHVVLGLAHVSKTSAAGTLGSALDNIDTSHVLVVNLKPHLDACLAQVVAQQHGRVNAAPPDLQAHAGEGFAATTMCNHQHVARLDGFACAGEHGGARTGRIHFLDLHLVQQLQRLLWRWLRGDSAGRGALGVDSEGRLDLFCLSVDDFIYDVW